LDELLKKEGIKLDIVIQLAVDDELLITRVSGRRVHQPSGRTYHIEFNPPKVPGKDDVSHNYFLYLFLMIY
jgi:adenylate kinase